jgi:hypothetical protein
LTNTPIIEQEDEQIVSFGQKLAVAVPMMLTQRSFRDNRSTLVPSRIPSERHCLSEYLFAALGD